MKVTYPPRNCSVRNFHLIKKVSIHFNICEGNKDIETVPIDHGLAYCMLAQILEDKESQGITFVEVTGMPLRAA